MQVKDYMTPEPLVVSPKESVRWIAELIRDHKVRQVPVVDGSNRLVGIVTDRDIRSADADEGGKGKALVAEDIMTTQVETIAPGDPLIEAAEKLHERHFGALPVVFGQRVVGMITRSDLLRVLIESLRSSKKLDDMGEVWPRHGHDARTRA